MKYLRIAYRLLALIVLSLIGVVLMAIYGRPDKNGAISPKAKKIRQWWLQKVIHIIGIHLKIKGDVPQQPAIWVANHVSWLDIPTIGSQGVAFLSKSDVRKWPVIGWLGEKGGTVFINRGGLNAAQAASGQIAEKIHSGDSILVFPEATITDGNDVKRFHARIFAPAIDHHLPVQPIAIRYLDKQGQPNRDIPWMDESFFANLFKILGSDYIVAEITFLPLINSEDFSERKKLADFAYNQVRKIIKDPSTNDAKAIINNDQET